MTKKHESSSSSSDLPIIFGHRKQRKKHESSSSDSDHQIPPPLPGPIVVYRNAMENYEYTTRLSSLSSSSLSSSTTCTSPGSSTSVDEVALRRVWGVVVEASEPECDEGVDWSPITYYSADDEYDENSYTDNQDTRSPVIIDWQKGARMGEGLLGLVYEGICSGGMLCAINEVSLPEQGSQGRESILSLQQEIEFLRQLQHQNIVQYLGTAMDDGDANLYIFTEHVDKGSLARLYQIYIISDSIVSAYTRQILSGLNYLHSRNIVHRSITCANILIASTGDIKLADFGLAEAASELSLQLCKGTALWMAPEVVNQSNQGYGTAADIWSLGCTVLEMATGQLPYHPLDSMQALYRIGQGEPPPVPGSLSTDLRDFIFKCLQVDPNARPSAAELLNHPFLKRRYPKYPASPVQEYFVGQLPFCLNENIRGYIKYNKLPSGQRCLEKN